MMKQDITTLFAWLISHQPAVLFSQNKPATSNQPTVLFSQNKPAPAISNQPNEQAVQWENYSFGLHPHRQSLRTMMKASYYDGKKSGKTIVQDFSPLS
jgi:hypothetical protein